MAEKKAEASPELLEALGVLLPKKPDAVAAAKADCPSGHNRHCYYCGGCGATSDEKRRCGRDCPDCACAY